MTTLGTPMLDEVAGIEFRGLPMLRKTRDLEFFEMPILSEFRSEDGELYLEKWCTRSAGVVRTLVVPSQQRAIAEYLAGRRTMRGLLTKPNADVGFIFSKRRGVAPEVLLVQVSRLPARYLPDSGVMHDASLRPEWSTIPQSFLLDADWDAKLIADCEKNYLEVFSFNYFTHPDNDNVTVPPGILTWVYDSGYTYGNAFKALRKHVPQPHRARSAGLEAASPGILTIAAPARTATRVLTALAAAQREDVVQAYERLHSWSKFNKKKLDQVPEEKAADDIRRLCDLLSVEPRKLLPQENAIDGMFSKAQLLVAGKLIAAYYGRLWKLLRPKRSTEFLAAEVEKSRLVTEPDFSQESEDDDDIDD